jgi:hypothetical protein
MSPHEEFLELAAASTSGELTQEERDKLEAHLAICASCRRQAKELESAILAAVPAMAPHVSLEEAKAAGIWSQDKAEARLLDRLAREQEHPFAADVASAPNGQVGHRGYFPSRIRWGHLGLTAAAIALFALSLGVTAYRSVKKRNANGAATVDALGAVLEEQLADSGRDARSLVARIADRDRTIANLKQEMQQNSAELKQMKARLSVTLASAQSKNSESTLVAEENKRLAEEARATEIRNDELQKKTQTLEQERSELSTHSTALEAKVAGLTEELRGQQETVARQKEYLDHDRDIRELMGARDRTMSPLIPPGTFVQIDPKQNHVRKSWGAKKGLTQSPYARPIYFLDIRSGYAFGWCQIENGVLTLIPHPDSGKPTRTFRYPNEVEVVGLVTGIAMRIGEESQVLLDEVLRRQHPPKK